MDHLVYGKKASHHRHMPLISDEEIGFQNRPVYKVIV